MAKRIHPIDTREFHGDSAEIQASLAEILASSSFSNSDRLKGFLAYVVDETLHGRGDAIKGKTIALDVYERSASTDGDPENVVRVDARRLRRRLADYYQDEGKAARIRIHIDSGGYTPRFERMENSDDPAQHREADQTHPENPNRLRTANLLIGGLAVGFAAVFILGYFFLFPSKESANEAADTQTLERQALLEKSPASLQAVNMAKQARELMLPLFDLTRQKLALELFQQAIARDPDYSGGYAGAAQVLGTLAVLSPDGPQKTEFQTQSRQMAKKAIALNPTSPWAQSAASWARYANKEYDEAVRLSARAYSMAPDNLQILEIYGAVTLWNGDFPKVVELLETAAMALPMGSRSGVGNVYAAAAYQLGDYKETMKALKISSESGGPISPAVVAIQAAASHAMGDLHLAQNYASDLQSAWPGVPIDLLLQRLFRDPDHAHEIIWRLKEAGWSTEPKPAPQ